MRALLLSEWGRDVRLALRSLSRSPGFAAVAVLSLALGIGANTAIFSLVDAVLIRPLAYRQPDRLVVLWEANASRHSERNVVNPGNFLEWKRRNTVFAGMALSTWAGRTLVGPGGSERVTGRAVTAGLFDVLGAAPALGRGFRPEEEVQAPTTPLLLSWDLWQRRFGGDASILGRILRTSDGPCQVVGVMPRSFRPLGSEEYWEPFPMTANARVHRGRYAVGWARLKPGVSLAAARAEMAGIARHLAAEYPGFDTGWTVQVVPLQQDVVGGSRTLLLLLFATVSLVLLIACANLGSLVLSRAAGREREVAIRLALGASRARIVRQAVTESLVLAFAGGIAGLAAARWGLDLLVARAGDEIPRLGEVALNGRAVAFGLLLSTIVGILFGLFPLRRIGRAGGIFGGAIHGGGTRTTARGGIVALRGILAAGQIAVAVVLTSGTGLLVASMANLKSVEPGFSSAGVTTFRVILPNRYQEGDRAPRFFDEMAGRLRRLPGVRSAAAGSSVPLGGADVGTTYSVAGRPAPAPGEAPTADIKRIDAQFLATLRIPLLQGRGLSASDGPAAPTVALVNRALARQTFGDASPIGERLEISFQPLRGPAEIVGVVGDVRGSGIDEPARPTVYLTDRQSATTMMTLAVRMDPGVSPPLSAIRQIAASLEPDAAPDRFSTLDSLVASSLGGRRFPMFFLAPFSLTALLLSAVGVYGVLSLAVRQRVREIGVRIALGAQARDVMTLVLGRVARLAVAGAAAGLVVSLLAARAMRSLLYGIAPNDPPTIAMAVALVLAVALLASILPTSRAVRIDPMTALREE